MSDIWLQATKLTQALRTVVDQVECFLKSASAMATKHDLKEMENRIMSKITDQADQEQANFDSINASLDGIIAGITALDTLITNLQNSPGPVTAEDQKALDKIQDASAALKTKAQNVKTDAP